jgi:dTDP-4-dehydrorhamnose reductase
MRALVFGAAGMLGTDLLATAPADVSIIAPSIDDVDITDSARLSTAFDDARPELVINAAAYTAVDRAESERAIADAVNGTAPALIGAECARRGIAVVHFGTDYVFPGTASVPYRESDPVAPLNAYGHGKLLGEQSLLASGAHALILRTQWLFGVAGKSFPRTMWERATAAMPTRVVNDQYGRPTYTRDLATATWQLIARGESGIIHVTNGGDPAPWFDLASEVFARAGAAHLLSACTTADYPTHARRPAYSVLSTDRLTGALGHALPDWREALERFLVEMSVSADATREASRAN